MRKRACLFSLALLLLSLSPSASLRPGHAAQATVKAASELDYPPFALVQPDGSAAGFAVDLLKAVAEAVHLDVTFQVGPWNAIKEELAEGKIDALPFMSYSAERARVYDFSIPYLRMHGTIFVRRDNTDIRKERDLKGKEIIVMRGDTAHEYAVGHNLSDKIFLTDSYEEAFRQLSGGLHDAVVVQQVAGWQLVKKLGITNLIDVAASPEKSIKISEEPLAGFEQKFCIAVKKGNAPLLAKLNEGLSIVFSNGVFDALYAKWFGPILPARPVDTKELIKQIAYILIPALLLMALAGVLYLRREVARKTRFLRNEIKERLQAEEKLRDTSERLRFVLEGSHLGYWDWDIKNNIVRRNALWAQMLGYELEEIDGDPGQWLKLIHPDDREAAARSIEDHLAGLSPMHRMEYRMLTKSGQCKWILDQAKVMKYEADGAPLRMCGTHADVTERKSAEIAHRESDAKLEAALASMSDGVFITDANGTITHSNEAFARLCGFKDLKEAMGDFSNYPKLFDVFFPNGEPAPVEQWAVPRALRGETSTRAEYLIQRKDSPDRWIGCYSFSPIYDNENRIAGSACIVRDITEDKNIERQLREAKEAAEIASKAKSEFLANMSHELRTPLNGVLGMLQLLELTETNEEQEEYVQSAIKATNRLTRLLGDILDISRIEAGKMQIIEAEFSTISLRDATVELFSLAAKEKGLEFTFDVEPGAPARVIGDESRIRQILFNLVGNAIKFTAKGSVRVAMGQLPHGDLETRLLFTVSDTGIGIPDECLQSVFDPFVQGEVSYTRRYQGAGLGLSIVRNLVKLLHAELAIENVPGKGTECYLSIPFRIPQDEGKETLDDPLLAEDSGTAPLRILLAEDDAASRLTAMRYLQKLGHEVVAAENGLLAFELISREDFDVVLMDVQMPVMDGVETTRAIRNGRLGAKSAIPIIAMTAYAMSRDREKFLAAGMDGYIAKPVDLGALGDVIREAMRKKAA